MITITSAEAQNQLGQLLDAVQQEPVAITRQGRPTAFIVSAQEMQDVLDARRRRGVALSELEVWSHQTVGTGAAESLTDEDVTRLVHETRCPSV